MEPAKDTLVEIYLGQFLIEEVTLDNKIAINIGNNVRIICHIHPNFPHLAKPGMTVPLYTKVPYNAAAIRSPLQPIH